MSVSTLNCKCVQLDVSLTLRDQAVRKTKQNNIPKQKHPTRINFRFSFFFFVTRKANMVWRI